MRTRALAVAVVLGALLLTAGPAYAHAAYKSSDPGKNEQVSQPPSRVEVELTEPVADASYLEVFDPCGNQVDQGNSAVVGFTITVGVQADRSGTYAVAWHAFAVDGHPTEGTFVFHSTGGAPCAGAGVATGTTGSSSGDGSGSSNGSGSGSGDAGGATSTSLGSGGPDAPSAGGNDGGGKAARPPAADRAGGRGDGNGKALAAALQETSRSGRSKGLLDLPYQYLLIGWLLAAGIGAVGGVVYVGIVGPRRR
jgi:copper resistance protein C